MTATADYAAYLRDQFAPMGYVATRRMFGATGIFCDGAMFAMVTDNTLYFRVDAHNRAAFQEAASEPPLIPAARTLDPWSAALPRHADEGQHPRLTW